MDGDGLHAGVPAISFKFPREPLDRRPTPEVTPTRGEEKIKAALSWNQPEDTTEPACDENAAAGISRRAGIKRSRRNEIWETGASSGMTFGAVQLMHKEERGGCDLDQRRHEYT